MSGDAKSAARGSSCKPEARWAPIARESECARVRNPFLVPQTGPSARDEVSGAVQTSLEPRLRRTTGVLSTFSTPLRPPWTASVLQHLAMKELSTLGLHEAVWAQLYGDHRVRKTLSPEAPLLSAPNFANAEENQKRVGALQERRAENAKQLEDASAAGLLFGGEIEPADLLLAKSAWQSLPFYELAREYEEVDAGSKMQTSFGKTPADVAPVKTLRDGISELGEFNETSWFGTREPGYHFHRTTWVSCGSGNFFVPDGTHRMLAVAWSTALGRTWPHLRCILIKK